jgi:hypothetical protein
VLLVQWISAKTTNRGGKIMGTNYFRRDARDIEFLLFEHMDVDKLLSYEAYKDFSVDDFRMIIDEAMKVAQEVLGPAMQDGDKEGCVYEDGRVRVPGAFHECWRVLAENGWMAVSNTPEFGGQGLPAIMGGIVAVFVYLAYKSRITIFLWSKREFYQLPARISQHLT